MGGLENIEN